LPKKTRFREVTDTEIREIENRLNRRPREVSC